MRLTDTQQKKVEQNMGLVHQVINDKVHGYNQWGFHTYDDLFQIGCIGLCKAAATDKGGTFSTYAYCLIWHEICDALIQSTRRCANEMVMDVTPYMGSEPGNEEFMSGLRMDLFQTLSMTKKAASPSTAKGIDAMVLMSQGYTSSEIGKSMGVSAKLVCAWVSKARKFLKYHPETEAVAAYCS